MNTPSHIQSCDSLTVHQTLFSFPPFPPAAVFSSLFLSSSHLHRTRVCGCVSIPATYFFVLTIRSNPHFRSLSSFFCWMQVRTRFWVLLRPFLSLLTRHRHRHHSSRFGSNIETRRSGGRERERETGRDEIILWGKHGQPFLGIWICVCVQLQEELPHSSISTHTRQHGCVCVTNVIDFPFFLQLILLATFFFFLFFFFHSPNCSLQLQCISKAVRESVVNAALFAVAACLCSFSSSGAADVSVRLLLSILPREILLSFLSFSRRMRRAEFFPFFLVVCFMQDREGSQ